MAQSIEDFFVSLGFKVDQHQAEKFNESLEMAKTAVEGLMVATGLEKLREEFSELAKEQDAVNHMATQIGMAADEIEGLGYAASINGSSVGDMESSLKGLTRIIGEASLGVGRGAMIFQKLGLNAKDANGQVKGTAEMLDEVAEKVSHMSLQEGTAFLSKMQLSPNLIELLRKGPGEIERLRREFDQFALNEEQEHVFSDYEDGMSRVRNRIHQMSLTVMSTMVPAFTELTNQFMEVTSANKDMIKQDLVRWGKNIGTALGLVVKVLGGIAREVMNQPTWLAIAGAAWAVYRLAVFSVKNELTLFQGAAKLAEMAMGGLDLELLPFIGTALLVAAAIAGIIVVGQDLYGYFTDQDSVTGDLVKQFPMLGEILDEVKAIFVGLYDAGVEYIQVLEEIWSVIGPVLLPILGQLWELLKGLLGAFFQISLFMTQQFLQGILALVGGVQALVHWFHGLWDAGVQVFKDLGDAWDNFMKDHPLIAAGIHVAGAAASAVLGGNDAGEAYARSMTPTAAATQGGASALAGGAVSGPQVDQSQHHTEVTVHVNGAQSPEDTAKAVQEHINKASRSQVRQDQPAGATL